MKDEIKEILDRAKNLKYKCDCCEEITHGKYIMRNDKQTDNLIEAVYIIDKLLDYITNLQEENEDYKSRIDNALKWFDFTDEYIENELCDWFECDKKEILDLYYILRGDK